MRIGASEVTARLVLDANMPRLDASPQHLLLEFGDHLGSTAFTIDRATGELVQYTTYSSYGSGESDYRSARWSSFREPYRFTGNEDDMEVGLSYHGARYYSPALHRWMSPDPVTIHSAGSDFNPYSYGYGNPTSYVDPDGRNPIIIGIVIGVIIAAATNATVQYATTGHINWGWDGVAGAALAGAVGGGIGAGVGVMTGSFAAAGAAGGAAGGATGAAVAGGSTSDILKSAISGAISGAVGGAIGVSAGSQSFNASTAFGGSMVGTAYGTASGVAWGALTGDAPTWQSVGIAFSSAFGGAIAGAALSKGWNSATEDDTAGAAARGQAAGESAKSSYDAQLRTMTEKYAAKLGARIASLPDYRTADIWLEAASGSEPALHLSVSIGDPNGAYKSYSFGAGELGADFGKVYEDVTGQGQILEYIKTDAIQDAQAGRYIREQWQADSRSMYGVEICRTYAMDKMRIFKIMFGNPTTIPASIQRPPPVIQPQSWIQRVANWISDGASSTGSSTSR